MASPSGLVWGRRVTQVSSSGADRRLVRRRRISTYLAGVGSAMSRCSPTFYSDMVSSAPTAAIYSANSTAAARRVRELIDGGCRLER